MCFFAPFIPTKTVYASRLTVVHREAKEEVPRDKQGILQEQTLENNITDGSQSLALTY